MSDEFYFKWPFWAWLIQYDKDGFTRLYESRITELLFNRNDPLRTSGKLGVIKTEDGKCHDGYILGTEWQIRTLI